MFRPLALTLAAAFLLTGCSLPATSGLARMLGGEMRRLEARSKTFKP